MNQFIFWLILCLLIKKINLTVIKDHSLDYYSQFPSDTKNNGIYHDTDIEDAEDDEDYNEENSFRNDDKLNSIENGNKLKNDQKISANIIETNTNEQTNISNNLKNNLENNVQHQTNSHTLSVIPSNSTAILNTTNSINTNLTTTNNRHLETNSSSKNLNGQQIQSIVVGLQLHKGLSNITKKTGEHIEMRCIFKCINTAGDRCEIKQSNLKNGIKWYKNLIPLKNEKNKIEISFIRRKNDYKDIVSKLNIYKLDTHDKGFYKCEFKYNRQSVDSVGVLQINDQEDTLDDTMKIETAIRANFDGLDDGSPLNSNHYESSLTNLDMFQKAAENKLFSNTLNSMDYLTTVQQTNFDKEQCIYYRDEICSQYLPNQTVIIQSSDKHRIQIKRLHNLVNLIHDFKTFSFQCLKYSMVALCHYTYPLCDKHQDLIIRKRMMCREDCEMLENSICKKEYELAKLQNLINDVDSILPNCNTLPFIGTKEAENCIHLDLPNMISTTVVEEENCFHDNGKFYRGKHSTVLNGQKNCLAWNNQHLISIADYPELYGHNYCRNVDGKHKAPYCIVSDGNSWRKEICDLKECNSNGLSLLIVSPALIACLLFSLILTSCCIYRWYYKNRKLKKKNKKCIVVPAIENTIRSTNASYSTMQAAQQRLLASLNNSNVNLFPNILNNSHQTQNNDLNLISMNKYGITYLPPSSNIELNSLLSNSNHDYKTDSCYQLENSNILNNLNIFQNAKNLSNKKSIGKNQTNSMIKHYPSESILFLEELGHGAFGIVFRGYLNINENELDHSSNKITSNKTVIPIAIKTLKDDADTRFKSDFKNEALLMADLTHPNIVSLLGVCFDSHPMCMLFEYMEHGDLHRFLLNHSPVTNTFMPPISSTTSNYSYLNQNSHSTNSVSNFSNSIDVLELNDLLHIVIQIASGMEYLSNLKFVHRDLAARNCLVSDHLTVKIGDFGLSRDIYESDYYRVQSRSLLPVRWMPKESLLFGRFSSESDVWSYGVVCWECFSYGMQPYYGKNNQEVIEEVIRKRNLLERPENCPINIYNLMLECWNEIPCKRPNFTEIHSRLKNLKAVYSNNCIQASSSFNNNNNLNNSSYEVFDQLEQQLATNKIDTLNLPNANKNENLVDSNQVVNSNSCGNLLYQNNSDSIKNNNSPCLNKLSIFKQSKTVDKNLDSEQYQQPLTFNHYKNCNNNLVNSTGNLNSNQFSKLTKNFSIGNNIQKHLKNINYKETFKSNSSFKLNDRKS